MPQNGVNVNFISIEDAGLMVAHKHCHPFFMIGILQHDSHLGLERTEEKRLLCVSEVNQVKWLLCGQFHHRNLQGTTAAVETG